MVAAHLQPWRTSMKSFSFLSPLLSTGVRELAQSWINICPPECISLVPRRGREPQRVTVSAEHVLSISVSLLPPCSHIAVPPLCIPKHGQDWAKGKTRHPHSFLVPLRPQTVGAAGGGRSPSGSWGWWITAVWCTHFNMDGCGVNQNHNPWSVSAALCT